MIAEARLCGFIGRSFLVVIDYFRHFVIAAPAAICQVSEPADSVHVEVIFRC
jgi:hypothetical protein